MSALLLALGPDSYIGPLVGPILFIAVPRVPMVIFVISSYAIDYSLYCCDFPSWPMPPSSYCKGVFCFWLE